MIKPYDIIKDSYLVAPTLNWMLNGYAKHTELTKQEFEAYFKARGEKQKENKDATS